MSPENSNIIIKRIKKGRDNLLKMTEGAGQTEKPS